MARYTWLGLFTCVACGASSAEPPRSALAAREELASNSVPAADSGTVTPATAASNVAAVPTATPAPAAPPSLAAALSQTPGDKFLVRAEEGGVELRSVSAPWRLVVIPAASTQVLYDPALELIWYLHENQLFVFDLRKPEAKPVLIVGNMQQVSEIEIERDGHTLSEETGCESPYAVLHWSAKPKVQALLEQTGTRFVVDGRAWLKAELKRPARMIKVASGLDSSQRVKLPKTVAYCDGDEEDESCGETAVFADTGWLLTRIHQISGGDCFTQSCLLYDPKSQRFAAPLNNAQWGAANAAWRGPCGTYSFDEKQTNYLVGKSLCQVGGACRDLQGDALGWVAPGAILGESVTVDADDEMPKGTYAP